MFDTGHNQIDYSIVKHSSTQGLPYDYSSIMHYRANTFIMSSSDKVGFSITPVNTSIPSSLLGAANFPTKFDFLHINLMYCGGICMMTNLKLFLVKVIGGMVYYTVLNGVGMVHYT